MATYARPTSDADRLNLLEMALATANTDQNHGKAYLAEETLSDLPGLLSAFATANQAVTGAQAEVTQAGQAVTTAFHALRSQLLRIWADARSRVRYGDDGPALLTFVQLSQTSRRPKPNSRQDWLQMADLIHQGLEQAVAAGFAPLADREQMGAVRDQAQAALRRLTGAKAELSTTRRNRALLRSQADRLSKRIVSDLRYALRDLPSTYQRQIMRSYGVRFHAAAAPAMNLDEHGPRTLAPDPLTAQAAGVVGWQMQPEAVATPQV